MQGEGDGKGMRGETGIEKMGEAELVFTSAVQVRGGIESLFILRSGERTPAWRRSLIFICLSHSHSAQSLCAVGLSLCVGCKLRWLTLAGRDRGGSAGGM